MADLTGMAYLIASMMGVVLGPMFVNEMVNRVRIRLGYLPTNAERIRLEMTAMWEQQQVAVQQQIQQTIAQQQQQGALRRLVQRLSSLPDDG